MLPLAEDITGFISELFSEAPAASSMGIGSILMVLGMTSLLNLPFGLYNFFTSASTKERDGFLKTHILLSNGISMVMLCIGENPYSAFGLFGAMALIRFRTILDSTKDTSILFISIVIGMACGLYLFRIALIVSLVTVAILLIFYVIPFGKRKKPRSHTNKLRADIKTLANPNAQTEIETLLTSNHCHFTLLNSEFTREFKRYVYDISYDDAKVTGAISDLLLSKTSSIESLKVKYNDK